MTYSNKILSQTVTQLCLDKGIDHIVISPGSRNAPLTIGFTGNPDFSNFSIVDERCAAFFALGMAQQLKAPVALVCTSGSALLNYYPAIAEAFYSDIPLVVISADRPKHLIDVGDGQTIRQENVYANHILYSANCEEGEAHRKHNETEINIALNTAIELNGPVHINVPFSEPLYETSEKVTVTAQNVPARISILSENNLLDLDLFRRKWNKSKKKMILVGVLTPEAIRGDLLMKLSKDENLIVLTETTSNLHLEHCFPSIDQLIAPLTESEFKELQPEILITFGGMVISKKVKAFIRKYPPKLHWHIDEKSANDSFFVLERHYKASPNVFIEELLSSNDIESGNYRSQWLLIKERRLRLHSEYLEKIPFSDLKVFDLIFKTLPKEINLQLSNSATVRYAQLFTIDASIQVFCNRGTSGIDGSTSTAIGAAFASERPTVFITGDLSFIYDSNALWNNYIPSGFRIIVINNRGGGIFRILPGAKKTEQFRTFFETKHDLTAKPLCDMYNVGYHKASTENELGEALADFYKISDTPQLLEIFTPSEENDSILINYFKYIK
tara:strand:+ start:10418 stop:12088 length:1671 start_codon:yes stop_codon:yes gene_type:complete